jgi:hypothetical protein
VSAQIADVQRLMKKSGLKYSMHSAGTTVGKCWALSYFFKPPLLYKTAPYTQRFRTMESVVTISKGLLKSQTRGKNEKHQHSGRFKDEGYS